MAMHHKKVRTISKLFASIFWFALVLFPIVFTGITSASETTNVNISMPYESVKCGETFNINISVNPSASIAGAQFDLMFDPSFVTVIEVREGNLLNQDGADTYFFSGEIDNTTGVVKGVVGLTLGAGEKVSEEGVFAVITLMAGPSEGTIALGLSNVIVADIEGQPVMTTANSSVIVIGTNNAPVFNTISRKWGVEGRTLSFRVSAIDIDGDELVYSATKLPEGASFNPATQMFIWTPDYDQSGLYKVNFQVSDGELSDTQRVTIRIFNNIFKRLKFL